MTTYRGVDCHHDSSDPSDTDSSSAAPSLPKQRCGLAAVAMAGGGVLLVAIALTALFVRRAPPVDKNEEVADNILIPSAHDLLGYEGPLLSYAGAVDNASLKLRDVLPRKPIRDNFRKWGGSAAVVSNSPAVLGTGLGAFIDSHDIIVRFNYAPRRGYEEDIGGRTDIRMLGRNHMFWEDEHEIAIHRYNNPQYADVDLPLMRQLRNPTTNRLYAFNNAFVDDIAALFNGTPTSGFIGVMFALHEFKNVSIFGFSKMDPHLLTAVGTNHYFNDTAHFLGPVSDFHARYNLLDDFDDWTEKETVPDRTVHNTQIVEWDLYDQFERLGRLRHY